jgi:DNA-binding transcriptional LysR family regulator
MTIDPRLLRAFVVLSEELHFGRAAERLNLAQPGLSQQIRRLEQQVGCRLFTRNSRIVELTDSGQAMLEPARTSLRAADQAERAAREAARITAHPLRVGINFFLEEMVATADAYASKHQEVQLWISRMYEPEGHEMLAAGVIDVFLGVFAPQSDSRLVRKRALDIPLFALIGPQHPLATRPTVPLDAYVQHPIAIFARDHAPAQFDHFVNLLSGGEGRHALSIREFKPAGTGSHTGILVEVGAGHAVGFGTPATLAARAGHLRILPFDPPLSLRTYISWDEGRSAHVDAFTEYFRVHPSGNPAGHTTEGLPR